MTEILLKVTLSTIKPNPIQEIILAKELREKINCNVLLKYISWGYDLSQKHNKVLSDNE